MTVTGIKIGKFQISYKALMTLLSFMLVGWLLSKNCSYNKDDGLTWNPTDDLKANIDIKR